MATEKLKTVNLEESIHRKLKVEATKKGKKLREYLIEILKKELELNDSD